MKIKIIQTGALILITQLLYAQGLLIQSGATFKTTGNVSIVVQDGNITNNGTTDLTGSNVYFSGAFAGTFGGTSNLSISNLYINKPSSAVLLGHDVNVLNQVVLQNGNLDLNGKTIALSPAGSLSGESETNRIISPSGGEITITVPLSAPLAENPGNLGAIINSAADLGNVTIKRGHKFYTNVLGANSVQRYYDIIPQNNTDLNAFLRFKYLDAETNSLSESALRVFKSIDNGVTWTNEGFSGRNTTSNFVDLSGINSFGKMTLSTGSALPVSLARLKATCSSGAIAAEWETLTELNFDKFLVQRSVDTRQWETVATITAAGNSVSAHTYTWSDIHPLSSYAFYRLQQVDKDGTSSYSTVTGAGCTGSAPLGFSIYPNPVKDILKARVVSPNAATAELTIYDLAGKLLKTKTVRLLAGVNNADVDMTAFAKGTYKLVLIIKGQESQVQKVIKQ